jgi:exo-beta-1,3-glucanase (GH17 family)
MGLTIASVFSANCLAQCPNKPFYGFCYSPYRDGESPNGPNYPSVEELEQDINIISNDVNFIRTYGIDHNLAEIPRLCEKYKIKCYLGCYISGNADIDQNTIEALMDIVDDNYSSIKGLLIGNEYISANIYDPCRAPYLIGLIQQVKSRTNLPVSTGEEWIQWHIHSELVAAVDFIASHHYAFTRPYICLEEAAMENVRNYDTMHTAYPDKEIILFETGWPTDGNQVECNIPSEENQARFLREFILIAKKYDLKYFIFSAFDEPWKYRPDKPYESHWGLYDVTRSPKIGISNVLAAPMADTNYDMIVNFIDYANLAADWLETRGDNDLCCVEDFNHDTVVDVNDLGLMSSYWLVSNSE